MSKQITSPCQSSSANMCKKFSWCKILLNHRKSIFLTAMLLFSVMVVPSLVLAEQTDATATITSAKEQFVTCYQAARDAEGAGANISSLTASLNEAGALLSQAESAYSANDFDTARNLAVQSQGMLGNFVSEANVLKENATAQRFWDFMINVVGSVIGTVAVLVGGVVVWLFLKKKFETVGAGASESSRV